MGVQNNNPKKSRNKQLLMFVCLAMDLVFLLYYKKLQRKTVYNSWDRKQHCEGSYGGHIFSPLLLLQLYTLWKDIKKRNKRWTRFFPTDLAHFADAWSIWIIWSCAFGVGNKVWTELWRLCCEKLTYDLGWHGLCKAFDLLKIIFLMKEILKWSHSSKKNKNPFTPVPPPQKKISSLWVLNSTKTLIRSSSKSHIICDGGDPQLVVFTRAGPFISQTGTRGSQLAGNTCFLPSSMLCSPFFLTCKRSI